MKVLHVITSLGGGGRERRMAQLVNDLNRNNIFQAIILTGKQSDRQDYEIPQSVEIFRAGDGGGRCSLYSNIKRAIALYRPDIVHVWTEVPMVLMSVSVLKLRFHFKLIVGFLADGNPVKSISCKLANKISYLLGDAIISNSKAGLIAKRAPQRKSYVIYNGFDFNRLNQRPFNRDNLIKEVNAVGKKVVAMYARFNPAKNWDMFLDLAQMSKVGGRDEILFLAVGSGYLQTEYQECAKQRNLDNIVFLGQRSDVENLLQITNIALLLSNDKVHAEGVSNSIMEAMAAGCPVIATRGGGTPEIIENGVTGYIIEPNDAETAYKCMIELVDNDELSHNFGIKGVSVIHERFTLSDMADKYISIYKII